MHSCLCFEQTSFEQLHRLGDISNSATPTTAFGGASYHFVCCVDSMGSGPFMFTACGDFCHGLGKSIEAARWRLYACETNYKIWRRSHHFVSCADSADIIWATPSVRGRSKFCETNYSIWRRISPFRVLYRQHGVLSFHVYCLWWFFSWVEQV